MSDVRDVIIIGSGMAGLTSAALLSRAGYKCVVLEQHDVAGGATHTFADKGGGEESSFSFEIQTSTCGAHQRWLLP